MTRRRDVLAGIAAIAAGGGITGAAAAVAQPDQELDRLIAEWLAAREAYRAARAASDEASARAKARYPAALPRWLEWCEANHPNGKYVTLPLGEDPSPVMQALRAEMDQYPIGADGYRHPPREFIRRIGDAHMQAQCEYYAQVEPAYNALVADRKAAIAAIDEEEGVATLADVRREAHGRANDAHEALLEYAPTSLQSFAAKVLVLLKSPFDLDGDFCDSGETLALIDDAEALIGGGAA